MEEIEWNRIGFENIGMERTVWKYGGKERLKNISQMFEECLEVVYSDSIWRGEWTKIFTGTKFLGIIYLGPKLFLY